MHYASAFVFALGLPLCTLTSMLIIVPLISDANDATMMRQTSYSKDELERLLLELPDLINELHSINTARDALYMYLMKIRTGQSNGSIGALFGVTRWTVQRRCELVRKHMKATIVPRYIQFKRSREELIAHKSIPSKIFFDNGNPSSAHLILDGTYIYIEKSQCHKFQKSTYNTHKKRNYIKIMMGVSTDGIIIFTLGPFKATENDAEITRKIFESETPQLQAYLPNDVMIVDRGFRDCVTELINRGFVVHMPVCSPNACLTTKEANKSRLVTKVRFEVERLNAVMKNTWQIFAGVAETQYIPHIMADFEIGAALINRGLKPRIIDENKYTDMANRMVNRLDMDNKVQRIVNKTSFEKLIRKQSYYLFENIAFPILSYEDLEKIACGEYQIAQARRYLSTQSNNQNLPIYTFFREDMDKHFQSEYQSTDQLILVMINLKSRFISTKVYRVFTLFDKSKTGFGSVVEYCCDCKVGSRTVGCCSHVMTLLYYLGYAPSIGSVSQVSPHLQNVFENNNYILEQLIDDREASDCDF